MPADQWCRTCGRVIVWRRKWARDWAQVRYCSKACRRTRLNDVDRALEDFFREALLRGAVLASAAVPAVTGADRERARRAARRLVAAGEAIALQGGRPVNPSTARGDFSIKKSG